MNRTLATAANAEIPRRATTEEMVDQLDLAAIVRSAVAEDVVDVVSAPRDAIGISGSKWVWT